MTQAKKQHTTRGVTFIEMIIVMAIFGLIAGVTIFNYRKFSDNVSLQNVTQNVALAITRAQRTAISGALPVFDTTENALSTVGTTWAPSYGVHVHRDIPSQFFYFFDINDDAYDYLDTDSGRYTYDDPGGALSCDLTSIDSECLDALTFPPGYQVSAICLNQNYSQIGDSSDCVSALFVDVVFTRPEPNPVIVSDLSGISIESATIYIREETSAKQKAVTIYATGQVQVK